MSKSTVNSYKKNTVWPLFSKYIRLRDCLSVSGTREYGKCCSCGRPCTYENAQAGHFLPGRKNSFLFYEKGVHLQGVHCNKYLQGNWPGYYQFMLAKYGKKEIEFQQTQYWKIKRYTMGELKELKREIEKKIQGLDNR